MKSGKLTLNIIIVVFVICALLFAWNQRKVRQLRLAENDATELQNTGDYESAISSYVDLLGKLPESGQQRIKEKIAQCYVAMAEDPTIATARQAQLYRQAESYVAGIVTDPVARALMDRLAPLDASLEKGQPQQ